MIDRDDPANRAMYWHDVIPDAVTCTSATGGWRCDVGDTGFGEEAFAARSSGSCSTRSTGRSTRAGSGRATARRKPIRGPRARRRSAGDDVPARSARDAPIRRRTAAAAGGPPRRRRRPPRWLRACSADGAAPLSSTWSSPAPTWAPRAGGCAAHSPYNHYVYLADGWLHGRLALAGQPPNENDWAKIDVLKLRDGREVRGIYGSRTGGPVDRFYPLRGAPETIPAGDIVVALVDPLRLVPAVPGGADGCPSSPSGGCRSTTCCSRRCGPALNPMLLFLLLRAPARARVCRAAREVDDLWLTALFGVGLGLLLLLGRRAGLVHRADRRPSRCRSATCGRRSGRDGRCWRGCSSRSDSRRGRPGWCFRCSSSRRCASIGGWRRAARRAKGWRALARRWLRFALPIAVGRASSWPA